MKKIISLILVMVMALSVFAGCSNTTPDTNGAKEIVVGRGYEATTLDPAHGNDDGSYGVIFFLGEGLVRNKNGQIVPGVAERWELSDDGLEATFYLRKDAKWSDGQALTAEDFRYTFLRMLNPERGFNYADSAFMFKNGEKYYNGEAKAEEVGIEVVDDYTLKITREDPSPETLYELAATAFQPVRKDFDDQHGVAYGAEAANIMTNGAFTLTEWAHGSKMILVKNENYWDKDAVKLDKITMILGVEGDTAVDMAMAGQIDLMSTSKQEHVDTLTGVGFNNSVFSAGYQFVHMNSKGRNEETGKFMANSNFRRALNLAVNREAIVAAALKGRTPANRVSAPSMMGVNDTFNKEYAYEGWKTAGDLEEAKKYFDLAMTELGTTVADIPELSMLIMDSEGNMTIMQAVHDMFLNAFGITCKIDPQPIQQMIGKAISGDFDFWFGGVPAGTMDWLSSGSIGSAFYSDPEKDDYGTYNYCNERFNELYDKASVTMDLKERKDLMFEMEKILCEDPASILLGWNTTNVLLRDNYTGLLYSGEIVDYTYLDVK